MAFRAGRNRIRAPLLMALFFSVSAAVQSPEESAYRDALAATERGQTLVAARKIEAALARFGASDNDWVWGLRVLHGDSLCGQGDCGPAAQWLDQNKPPRRLARSETAVRWLISRATTAFVTRDAKTAASLFAEAKRLAAEIQPSLLADVHLRMAALNINLESNARAALAHAEKHKRPLVELGAINDLERFCIDRRRWSEGIHWGERGLALAREVGAPVLASKLEGNLGWAYRELGDLDLAAEIFETAERGAAAAGQDHDRFVWLDQIGSVHLDRRDLDAAAKYYTRALELARTNDHGDPGAIAGNMARVALEQKKFDLARHYNEEARTLKRARGSVEGLQGLQITDGRIALAAGRFVEAKKTFEAIAAKPQSDAMKWESEARLAEVYVAMRDPVRADGQYRRAIASVRSARKSIDASSLRYAFFHVAEDVFDGYIDFLVEQGRHEDALAATESIRAQTLEEFLGVKAAAAKPRQVAADRGATILCYWLGRASSYLWIITPKDVTLKTLPAEREIERAVEAYGRLMLDVEVRDERLSVLGQLLYRRLVEPAAAAIGRGSRVIVVPDGRLHALNMESLIVPGTNGLRFWIQDVTLVNASSLRLLAQRVGRGDPKGENMLVVGDPPLADPAYPPLRKAKLEIDRVRRHFAQTVVLEGRRATPAGFRTASPERFAYLHFVAHGEATRRKPLDASVILGKDADGTYKLLGSDVIQQQLTARLVTVSSCHGAGTRAFVGEGLVGLAWAFLGAGAQQVVAALWEVDDVATPGLMDAMYGGIRAGKDPAAALREAKLRLLTSKGIHRKPFYWAPFVLYGGM